MKKIVCKNCGASFSEEFTKCPYCGTINRKGAYKDFRKRFSDIVDSIFGLKEEVNASLSKNILMSIFRGLVLIAICVGIGALWGNGTNVNYYNDREYDERALSDIIWEDENLDKLEEAYANGDLETVGKLLSSNSKVAYSWEHASAYNLKKEYLEIVNDDRFFDVHLRNAIYLIFEPDYFANMNKMSEEEYEEYLKDREALIAYVAEKGYDYALMEKIYEECADEYGYISLFDMEKYMKEADNG